MNIMWIVFYDVAKDLQGRLAGLLKPQSEDQIWVWNPGEQISSIVHHVKCSLFWSVLASCGVTFWDAGQQMWLPSVLFSKQAEPSVMHTWNVQMWSRWKPYSLCTVIVTLSATALKEQSIFYKRYVSVLMPPLYISSVSNCREGISHTELLDLIHEEGSGEQKKGLQTTWNVARHRSIVLINNDVWKKYAKIYGWHEFNFFSLLTITRQTGSRFSKFF